MNLINNDQSKTFNINHSLYDNKANINANKIAHIDYINLQDNIQIKKDDTIIFNGKEFKIFSGYNKYKSKDNNNRIIYKCINNSKNEKLRIETNQKYFFNPTKECKINKVNQSKQYKLIQEHSIECGNLIIKTAIKIEKNTRTSKEEYIKE